ncbi:MAG: DUF370 domain-containing protein [Oscillospiraceae bacterium]|nr:DUF370 domain-containing protein [Oscillospiraceae bacterium]
MYLHLGNETVIKEEEIIGIFDLENASISRHTRKFLAVREKEKQVVNVSYELPKSFIVCKNKNKKSQKVYISQISTATLLKRLENVDSLI